MSKIDMFFCIFGTCSAVKKTDKMEKSIVIVEVQKHGREAEEGMRAGS